MTKNRTRTPVYLDPGMHSCLEVKGLITAVIHASLVMVRSKCDRKITKIARRVMYASSPAVICRPADTGTMTKVQPATKPTPRAAPRHAKEIFPSTENIGTVYYNQTTPRAGPRQAKDTLPSTENIGIIIKRHTERLQDRPRTPYLQLKT